MHNGVTLSLPRGQLRSSEAKGSEEAKNPAAAALSCRHLPLATPPSSPTEPASRPLNIKVELQQTTLVSIQLGGRDEGRRASQQQQQEQQQPPRAVNPSAERTLPSVCRWNASLVLSTLLLAVILSLLIYVEASRMVMVPITIFLIVLSLVLFFFILFCVCFVVFL